MRVLPNDTDGQPIVQRKKHCLFTKSQDFPITIGPQDLRGLQKPTSAIFAKSMSKQTVFDKLRPWIERRYQKLQPEGHWSRVEWKYDRQKLKFNAIDLQNEVIKTESKPWLCSLLCGCQCTPYEQLAIEIMFEEVRNERGELTAFNLNTNIAAKYGSGVWKPMEGGWHDLDDEPAKKRLLEKYGEQFRTELFDLLTKP